MSRKWTTAVEEDQASEFRDLSASLLYKDGKLADHTVEGWDRLAGSIDTLPDLQEYLTSAFGSILLDRLADGEHHFKSNDQKTNLIAVSYAGCLRLDFSGAFDFSSSNESDTDHSEVDLALLVPQPIWQIGPDGALIWSNAAYQDVRQKAGGDDAAFLSNLPRTPNDRPTRCRVSTDPESWFDVTAKALQGGLTYFATDVTALVHAEKERQGFVQTLGKTFADLSIGLAIFDKQRTLQTFNPALLEMTKLPFAFLSEKPRIEAVLDRLRELQMIPEPKDYDGWREKYSAVEDRARRGTFCENWALPGDQTFRVSGRPHPDGAFALLFEDITSELALTRRFRAEIETAQCVMDTLGDALAVFSQAGTLVLNNRAYDDLWGVKDAVVALREFPSEMAIWQKNTVASPIWIQLRDFIRESGQRKPWFADALLIDGRPLRCHAAPLEGGMTLARFEFGAAVKPVIRKLTAPDPAILARQG
ncbi:PAS-domain containing protein [Yoonia litorea]|uniref:PAS-domain containing protein n=1 Tax=Yoonia litorea TaxID=1123755 RepID=UPI001A965CCF|nr:PAS-domain containing protein [Yoonia litorea]